MGAPFSNLLPNLEASRYELDTSLEVFGVNNKGQGRWRGPISFELHAPTTAMDGGEAMSIATKSRRKKTTRQARGNSREIVLQRQGRKQLQALMSKDLGKLFVC